MSPRETQLNSFIFISTWNYDTRIFAHIRAIVILDFGRFDSAFRICVGRYGSGYDAAAQFLPATSGPASAQLRFFS
jgi:hypothetical protein